MKSNGEIGDIEDIFRTKIGQRITNKYTEVEYEKIEKIVMDFLTDPSYNMDRFRSRYDLAGKFLNDMMKKHKITPRKEEILYVYRRMVSEEKIDPSNYERSDLLGICFKKKDMRETSGVMVFAVLSSPYPETGKFGYFESHNDWNSFWVKDGKINTEKDGIEIQVDPGNGHIVSIVGDDSIVMFYNSSVIRKNKTRTYTKKKELKVGDNISNLVNPMSGELRQSFSCPFDCYFCPSQPGMPKSYEDKEPAVARSLRHGWNVVLAMRDRFEQYVTNGMEVDKLEVIVKGGTWTSYNPHYRKTFCRDIFYAANTFWDPIDTIRDPKSLFEEQRINETARAHVIGLTVETRPDYITPDNLIEFRECGITRLELGFQHTDNKILKKINRQHTVEDSAVGIALLLACGFKVDIHLMPGLPNSTFDGDKEMVIQVLTSNLYRADQLKWYPTIVTPYTVIKDWYDKGRYKPWIEDPEKLIELTVYFKQMLNPWNRTNRIQRDFTKDFICGGSSRSNLGDMAKKRLKEMGIQTMGIRDREVRDKMVDMNSIELVVRKFESNSIGPRGDMATEYFISFEANNRELILGFLRLRLDPNSGLDIFPELNNCAMIRELHVYGKMNTVNHGDGTEHIQHLGLGTKLVDKAKEIARTEGYNRVSVISGVGVRNYYREKHNFYDGDLYLLCDL